MDQQQPAQPQLCSGGCGFFANASFDGLCSKCHREQHAAESAATQALAASAAQVQQHQQPQAAAAVVPPSPAAVEEPSPAHSPAAECGPSCSAPAAAGSGEEAPSKPSTRCMECRKKVGLTGFKCKCGLLFCGTHRYAEAHICVYDWKSEARAKLAAENPLVRADKVERF